MTDPNDLPDKWRKEFRDAPFEVRFMAGRLAAELEDALGRRDSFRPLLPVERLLPPPLPPMVTVHQGRMARRVEARPPSGWAEAADHAEVGLLFEGGRAIGPSPHTAALYRTWHREGAPRAAALDRFLVPAASDIGVLRPESFVKLQIEEATDGD